MKIAAMIYGILGFALIGFSLWSLGAKLWLAIPILCGWWLIYEANKMSKTKKA